MPGYTDKYGFPYPLKNENADGPAGFQSLAQKVEDVLSTKSGVPVGVIAMWSGTTATVPAGWHLCDGQVGTPDLRGRFIVGASQDAGAANTYPTYNVAAVGGEDKHKLLTAELPIHTHVGSPLPTHDHNIDAGGTHEHSGWTRDWYYNKNSSGGLWAVSPSYGEYVRTDTSIMAAGGSHTHNADLTGAGTPVVANTGADTPHENRPTYYALAYIMKLAEV